MPLEERKVIAELPDAGGLTGGELAPLMQGDTTVKAQLDLIVAYVLSRLLPAGLPKIVDKDLTAPPGSPATGVRYIVAATATGDWTGQEGKVATWSGTAWSFVAADADDQVWVNDEDSIYHWTGSAWASVVTPNLAAIVATGALSFADWINVASATTTNIGAIASNFVNVTGTTTITGLGTVAAGAFRLVKFAGVLTLTHNATSLILPGAANIVTAADDVALFKSEGAGNWRCIAYTRASGKAVTSSTLAGSVIGYAKAAYTANADLSTAIPNDDTIPQNTEGTQILSISYAASSATSKLLLTFNGVVTVDTTALTVAAALFVDSGANAVRSTANRITSGDDMENLLLVHELTPGDTASHDYKIRVGPASNIARMNGYSTGRKHGGAMAAVLSILEIKG